MQFLLNTDWDRLIKPADLATLTSGNTALQTLAEEEALETIIAHLDAAYDTARLLRPFTIYTPNALYFAGDRIYDAGRTYLAQGTVPPGSAIDDTSYFAEADDRSATLVRFALSLALHGLHLRLAPAPIPGSRVLDAAYTREVLTGIQHGKINLGLPRRPTSAAPRITMGSAPKQKTTGWW